MSDGFTQMGPRTTPRRIGEPRHPQLLLERREDLSERGKGFFQAITRKISIPAFERFQRLPGKITEALREATSERGLFIPAMKARVGEQPPVSLAALVDYYLKDPAVMASVDNIGEQVAGTGFYTVCEPGFEEAKKIIDDFCDEVNMDGLLMQTSKEVVLSGNCFWERVFDKNKKLLTVVILPLSSIKFILRRKIGGRPQSYIQQIGADKVEFTADEIIHFRLNPVDGSAWGTGILHSLATSKQIDETSVRPAFLEIKARLEDDIQRIVHRYAAPKRLWKFEGVGDEKLEKEYAPTIQSAPTDADFVTNKPVEVDSLDINPSARFDGMIGHIDSQVVQGLQTPMTRLFTTPGFTEASATEATKMADRKIMYLQRVVARIVEREVFKVLLRQNEIDPKKARVRIRWGMPERPEVKIDHIVQLAQISATSGIEYLTRDEVRNMLAKYAGFELQEHTGQTLAAEGLKEMRFFRDKGGKIHVVPETDADREQYAAKLAEGWDESHNYIRRRVREPDTFQPYSFRTIWLSQGEGIRAVVGRLKGEDKLTIQSIMFAKKNDWTLEKARKWIKDHPDLEVSELESTERT